ncbi:hypothetical protein IE53DRAFT_74158 [Violaceomyces palustris]|uniref:Uncharacterized protein n=1 Tax=Violaceomyces palustris TaxID=1673888 RepID=A0ACD0NYS3_9BASI|nr:hypothetical protein IE53DRAFT_74158 [Violaceomyces palustris]
MDDFLFIDSFFVFFLFCFPFGQFESGISGIVGVGGIRNKMRRSKRGGATVERSGLAGIGDILLV